MKFQTANIVSETKLKKHMKDQWTVMFVKETEVIKWLAWNPV